MDSLFNTKNKMKINILLIIISIAFVSCEKDYQHDTGLADGYHDCSMMDYMRNDHYNWDSTVVAIEHAGLTDIFDGKSPEYKEITFFGPTNMSIRQYLLKTMTLDGEQLYHSVREMPVELVKTMILSYVVKGKYMKESFDYEVKGTLEGGTKVKTLNGIELRVYRTQNPFMGIPDIGAEGLAIHALESGQMGTVLSADIQVNNGVVHSLSNKFQWIEL